MESKISGRGHIGKKRQEGIRLHIKIMEKGEGPQKKRKKMYILEKETGFTVEELRKVGELQVKRRKEEREQRGEQN
jgi:hypothetical protein